MLRSMYSGVAGLKTHQVRMDVIGNNIANVNTTAYKSSSIQFSDVMYQTSQNASGATETTGGINAKQVGLGSKSAAISTAIESQGATQTTNNPFDLMISGSAFFVVDTGAGTSFTRDGSFYLDGAGNLAMQSTGYYVQGWSAAKQTEGSDELTINKNGGIGPLQLMSEENATYPPASTTASVVSGNIDAEDKDVTSTAGKTVTLELYDNLGYLYTAKFTVKDAKNADGTTAPNAYNMTLSDIIGPNNKSIFDDLTTNDKTETIADENPKAVGWGDYSTDATGKKIHTDTTAATKGELTITVKFDPKTGSVSKATIGENAIDADPNNPTGIDVTGKTGTGLELQFNQATTTAGGVNLTSFGSMTDQGFFSMDLSTLTNVNTNKVSTIKANKGDLNSYNTGRKVGTMNGLTIGTDGKINATYTNGQTKLLGQIAVTEFSNPSGLEKIGDNLYNSTMNSGDPSWMDVSMDGGKINTGVLEMSNVDLSNEFTNMITAQRGFQANSRIITVSDTLLEELTNLKR